MPSGGEMPNVIELLQKRGFIDALSSEDIRAFVEKPQKVYCGFDPTSDSLHLGNFIPMMGLSWFQRCGHTPVAILGGATGMIGDPGGKTTERALGRGNDQRKMWKESAKTWNPSSISTIRRQNRSF